MGFKEPAGVIVGTGASWVCKAGSRLGTHAGAEAAVLTQIFFSGTPQFLLLRT